MKKAPGIVRHAWERNPECRANLFDSKKKLNSVLFYLKSYEYEQGGPLQCMSHEARGCHTDGEQKLRWVLRRVLGMTVQVWLDK